MTIEYSQLEKSFEQNSQKEIERKFIAHDSSIFEQYRPHAEHITQLYLSKPDDEYGLRLRKSVAHTSEVSYSATLKSRGHLTPEGIERMEIETAINEETFERYASDSPPILHKERAILCEGVSIDWIEGSATPIIEVENPALNESASQFLSLFSQDLIERTGYSDVDNESIAYALYDGTLEQTPRISAEDILNDILAYRSLGTKQLVIGIGGRSGSGKSTLARELQALIQTHPDLQEPATLVSTDDYHRGRIYLESRYGAPWTNWEDARVYDTEQLARDIAAWRDGEPMRTRWFDFTSEEPHIGDQLPSSDILIVEGIHAGSRDLAGQRHMYYNIGTSLATSLGRDLERLMRTDRQQAAMRSPEDRLRYMIEIGEPTYRTIEDAPRNRFAASVRPLGSMAIAQWHLSGTQ